MVHITFGYRGRGIANTREIRKKKNKGKIAVVENFFYTKRRNLDVKFSMSRVLDDANKRATFWFAVFPFS
jgi:hypothetical protein